MPEERNKFERYKSLYGLGLSDNIYLNILVIFTIGIFGLIIKLFFSPEKDMYGKIGPANTNIGGYTLLLVSYIIIFCSFFGVNNTNNMKISLLTQLKNESDERKSTFSYIMKNKEFLSYIGLIIPIILVCIVILYILFINFNYLEKINKLGGTPPIFNTYDFISTLLFITTTIVIYKYSWEYLFNKSRKVSTIKWIAILLSIFNILIIFIIHIILEFYTLGSNEYITNNT